MDDDKPNSTEDLPRRVVRWSFFEIDKVRTAAIAVRKNNPHMPTLAVVTRAMQDTLPPARHRVLRQRDCVPESILTAVDDAPVNRSCATTSDIIATPEDAFAIEVAKLRLEKPAADFVDIYNIAREHHAPSLPEVTAVRYINPDLLSNIYRHHERLIAKPAAPVEEPPTKRALALEMIDDAIGQLVEDRVNERAMQLYDELAASLNAKLAEAHKQLETTVLDLLVQNASMPQPATVEIAPVPQPVELATPEPEPAKSVFPPTKPAAVARPTGKFRVVGIDAALPKMMQEIRVQIPANVAFEEINADHRPNGSMRNVHYVIVTHRTPREWVAAYSHFLPRNRIINMGTATADSYVKMLTDISHRTWFELA